MSQRLHPALHIFVNALSPLSNNYFKLNLTPGDYINLVGGGFCAIAFLTFYSLVCSPGIPKWLPCPNHVWPCLAFLSSVKVDYMLPPDEASN